VHYFRVRHASFIPTRPLVQPGLERIAVAGLILAAHIGIVYLGMTLAPAVSRSVNGTIAAHFVEAPQHAPERWEPPAPQPVTAPVNISLPVAPAIEVPLEQSPTQATAPLYIAASAAASTPASADRADTPRLISSVEYIREPVPRYPPQSRRLKEQGLVVLRVLIDEKGQACDIEIESSSGHVRLDHAAKAAVAQAMFRPYVEDGAPRRALVLIPIEFSLNSGKA
jgi:periplasmic protein TonB